MAYQPDNKGSYPIHVAASAGCLGGVDTLLRRCPDCATLRDGQGRSFLHVAAESEEDGGVVEYAFRMRMAELSSILNAQDNDGDTALHKAVRAGNLAAFNCLIRNRQVRLDVPNNEALTPLDLSRCMLPPGEFYYTMVGATSELILMSTPSHIYI
jgi:ankyrin repeat protein